MSCKYLTNYSFGDTKWSVSSCRAKAMPYVPSMMELHNFCQGGKHVLCPFFLMSCQQAGFKRPEPMLAEVA